MTRLLTWNAHEFSGRSLREICRTPPQGSLSYYDRNQSLAMPFGRETTTPNAIGMMVFAGADRAGMPIGPVSKAAPALIGFCLLEIASKRRNWRIECKAEDAVRLERLLSELLQNRSALKDCFSLHERVCSRYMVMLGSEKVITTNDVKDLNLPSDGEAMTVLDGISIVNRLESFSDRTLFTAKISSAP